MAKPKLILFDVNETLLDLTALKESVGKALGGRPELLPLWFTTMLQYSLVTTVADRYSDFGDIAHDRRGGPGDPPTGRTGGREGRCA